MMGHDEEEISTKFWVTWRKSDDDGEVSGEVAAAADLLRSRGWTVHSPPPIVITEIKCTCSACPSQWEAKTEDGREVYIRYRHGCGRIDVNGETIIAWESDDPWGGVMSLDEVIAATGIKVKE